MPPRLVYTAQSFISKFN